MNLSDLVGHTVGLHGVDGNVFCVSKDGERKVYEAVENEGDGYRSSLDELREVPECNRVFSRRPYVTATARDKAGDCDIVEFVDSDGHVWLEVGTDEVSDYYPCFVFTWHPKESPTALTDR